MCGNIGWKYHKEYFHYLETIESNYELLNEQNNTLLEITYDNSPLIQILNVRNNGINTGNFMNLKLVTCYPGLITGIGTNHQTTFRSSDETQTSEFKLGMYFDHTTGIPVIPGSSVKGLLRSFFPIMNQNKYCECFDEKAHYIAAIIKKIRTVKNWTTNMETHKTEVLFEIMKNNKIIEIIPEYNELNTTSVKSWKEDDLVDLVEKGLIHEDELDLFLSESNDINSFIYDCFYKRKKEIIQSVYNSINSKEKRRLNNLVEKIFTEKILEFWNSPIENEVIDNSEINTALKLAIEMFEGIREDKRLNTYQKDTFFDAIPVSGDPNSNGKLFAKDYITPHQDEFTDPIPICFMKIRSKVTFQFYFRLHDGIITKDEKLMLIKYLILNNGVGAKTNIGYGQFTESKKYTT